MKKLLILVAVFVFSGVFASVVFAADLLGPTKVEPNVVVSSAQNLKNLYSAGVNVTVNGKVNGDLVTAGGMVALAGEVEEDVLALGGTVNLGGKMGGDVRAIGGNISVTAPVSGDLVLVAGNVAISGGGISGDLILAGGNVSIDAPVNGNVTAVGGNFTINSKISGNVSITADQSLTFGSNAEVLGKVVYKAKQKATVKEGAKVANLQFEQIHTKNITKQLSGLLTLAFLVKVLASFFVGYLLIKFKKLWLVSVSEQIIQKHWYFLGLGFATIVLVPFACLLLLVTLVGYKLAFFLGLAYVWFLMFVSSAASVVLGYLALKYFFKTREFKDYEIVLAGVILWLFLSWVPLLGWLFKTTLFLFVFGVLVKDLKNYFNKTNN